jgi:hypothetical protein
MYVYIIVTTNLLAQQTYIIYALAVLLNCNSYLLCCIVKSSGYLLFVGHEVVPPTHQSCVVMAPNTLDMLYATHTVRKKIRKRV